MNSNINVKFMGYLTEVSPLMMKTKKKSDILKGKKKIPYRQEKDHSFIKACDSRDSPKG